MTIIKNSFRLPCPRPDLFAGGEGIGRGDHHRVTGNVYPCDQYHRPDPHPDGHYSRARTRL